MASIGNVVQSGSCVGCGACSIITNREIPIKADRYGVWRADPAPATPAAQELGSRVCPFADESPDETALASEYFGQLPEDPRVGRYLGTFAAQVNNDEYLAGSSSGGLTSWILEQLLKRDLVDGVIHVGANGSSGLFSYQVSYTPEALLARRKSIYYSTSMVDAVLTIRGDGKRYALVAVPCFVTAARLMAKNDDGLKEQLAFFIGLVCGHMKSPAFAELLAWQLEIPPEELVRVDFRVKNPSRGAGGYDFEAEARTGEIRKAPTSSLLGGNWGHGLFQLDGCNYCDDVFAETADVVLGDAWLPEFVSDWRGHNVVVTRHPALAEIIEHGIDAGEITHQELTIERVADSQAGNYRHRRQGLQLRLHDDQAAGRWTPRKRVEPSANIPRKRKAVVRARRTLSAESHELFLLAKQRRSLADFTHAIAPLITAHDRAYGVLSYAKGAIRRASRRTRRWFRGTKRAQ